MRPPAARLDPLHLVLLETLAGHEEAMSTAQLRVRANQHPDLDSPVVHEAVYNALQRLRRLGHVDQQRTGGRHAWWALTDPERLGGIRG
jgi:hypothetical protein